jgi:1,4-alpha-glucan branching enzyme
MVEYAIKRTVTHVDDFLKLDAQIRSGDIDEPWLADIESRHNVFPTLDYRIYIPV